MKKGPLEIENEMLETIARVPRDWEREIYQYIL
jgi:hypothetical protein